jgi:uncharacterized protein (DUF488 family)
VIKFLTHPAGTFGINFCCNGMREIKKQIWTIGHSTRSIENFIELLQSFQITELVDVRTLPGSRKYPHFNKESLCETLAGLDIQYFHFPSLGGRRKPKPDSVNTAWRNPSFKGYADYMETMEFKAALSELEGMAAKGNLAYMCAESLWWKCHRALISDRLKIEGWSVYHILDVGKLQEHPYTSPARNLQGNLFYN